MAFVYIADRDEMVRRQAAADLRTAGIESWECADGGALLAALEERLPDALLLGWRLPDEDGLALLRRLRGRPQTRALPILMMACTDSADGLLGLEAGADDTIFHPFSARELTARVRAAIQRAERMNGHTTNVLKVGDICLDATRRRVEKRGMPVALTRREFDLLQELMRCRGETFTREQLMKSVWKLEGYADNRTVDVHIRYLRLKLEDCPDRPRIILTVRGVGYRLADPAEGFDRR